MKKDTFAAPEMEILEFESTDIVMTSPGNDKDGGQESGSGNNG